MNVRLRRALSLAILYLGSVCATAAQDRPGGVVIEEIGTGSALERAGLRPGDLLFAWERKDGRREIRTVFDWSWIEAEQAPRGNVRLRGERDGEAISFDVPERFEWEARVRPWMAAASLQTYAEGQRRVDAGDVEGGVSLWNDLVRRVEPDLRGWLLLRISEALSKNGPSDEARSALQAALAEAQDAQTRVALWEALGESYQLANEMTQAEASFRSALEAGETAWGESLRVAGTIVRLGNLVRLQSRLDAAEQLQERALEIRQREAPNSLEVAGSRHELSLVAWNRGDLDAMDEHIRRALAIQERWPSETRTMANTLNDQALLAFHRGRYAESAVTFRRALEIVERRSSEDIPLATLLARQGLAELLLGDLDSAEEVFQRALAIRERLAPESPGTAAILNSLGRVARERGDLAQAAEFVQRALRIWRKTAPEGPGVAEGLDALGIIARLRGDLDEAWKLHSSALKIRERLPNQVEDSIAYTLDFLGAVAEERGNLSEALSLYRRAHDIFARVAPATIREARQLQEIGRIYRRTRRFDQAEHFLLQAVEALESQAESQGGPQDLQAIFRAHYSEIYRDAIELELELGHADEAFHLVERSRARSFLALLAERDLAFSGEVPEALERSRRDNAARYDQTLRALARRTPQARDESQEDLHRVLSRLRWERDEINAEIRKASPRLAALRQPQPLDPAAARKVLDPGTLALSYSVGETRTALFAVTRDGGLRVKSLPVGEKQLRQDVERFLERVRQPAADDEAVDLARSLYSVLIAPVADLVENSERVLILPDGPLHRLPFGALVRDTKGGRQYLTEWKPLHTALSLTVYGTLRVSEGAPSPAIKPVIAFGDPRYPKDLASAGETRELILRSPGLRGFAWEALPYSRREVERVAEAYPGTRLYLGEEATEERAKAVARDARILHFATHGYLDDRAPLDSALVLTIPEGLPAHRDNGLLQVWEIFEGLRLDADLVVLSACESALGRELSGEGVIGLTRAFQYAGARSVVASLWSVTDQVTAELMTRFHRHYAAGLSKDEALRQAQTELMRHPVQITTANGQTVETDASAPFFWAAFQLFGDWR